MLLHEEVAQLQEEVHLLRQMKDMLGKDLQEESPAGGTAGLLSAAELHVQLGDKEQELDRAKEALQGEIPYFLVELSVCVLQGDGYHE